ncbi:MobC family plasmid mobilization relaxosome protein [uncultured Herbaspirillum sp.]|uniref:MobC family plasmid mobilization relaxosome protein n=1 Tax=uncultured Herbaspirillum sp. TaxID=160236 RepID=UPI003454D82E
MRPHCVSVRLSFGELQVLDEQRGRLPRGTHLRRVWSDAKCPFIVPSANVEALRQLRGVATNLNQLTRYANADQAFDLVATSELVERLRRVLAGLC